MAGITLKRRWRRIKFRIKQTAIAIDQLFNALFGGWCDETISSRSWRKSGKSPFWYVARKFIDTILFFDKDHCRTSYESEINRMHCPPSLRTEKDDYGSLEKRTIEDFNNG